MITSPSQMTQISRMLKPHASAYCCCCSAASVSSSIRPAQPLAQAVEVRVAVDSDEDLGASTDSRSPLVSSKASPRGANSAAQPQKEQDPTPLTASGVKREKEKAKVALKPKGQGPPPQLHELPDEILIALFAWYGLVVDTFAVQSVHIVYLAVYFILLFSLSFRF